MMMPTALVGSGWREFDIFSRLPSGEVRFGYHVKKIKEQERMQPNESNMVESKVNLRGEDPRHMPAIDINPPVMTAEQVELARIASVFNKASELLTLQGVSDVDTKTRIVTALLAVKGLLRDF